MADLTLFHYPSSCSRVTMIALEQCKLTYNDIIIDIAAGAQYGDYLGINPKARVPAILVDGKLLTEKSAILVWLNAEHPHAGLLPLVSTNWESAAQLSDLLWLYSGWHPYIRSIRNPARLTDGDPKPVRAKGMNLMKQCLDQFEAKIANRKWWYGDRWSIVDSYACWGYSTAQAGGFDLTPYPMALSHKARAEAFPAYRSAIARELNAVK